MLLSMVGLGGAFFMFAPEDRVNAVDEKIKTVLKDEGLMCLNHQCTLLKDADSARLISTTSKRNDGGGESVSIKYKAKNSYGAYGTSNAKCVVRNGKVDVAMTFSNNYLAALKHLADCLEADNKGIIDGTRPAVPTKCNFESSQIAINDGIEP